MQDFTHYENPETSGEGMPGTYAHVEAWRRGRTPLSTAATLALAMLFFSGDIKGSETFSWIPFDLTAFSSIVLVLLTALAVLAGTGKVSRQILWMCTLFLLLASASLWTEWTAYAVEKAERLFTIAVAGALIPAVILTRIATVRLFIGSLVVSGMLISSGVIFQLLHPVSLADQITGINSGSISLGRTSGIALVGLFAWSMAGKKQHYGRALLCIPLFLILFSSGSRGPVFFAVAVIAFVALRWSFVRAGNFVAISLILAAVMILLQFGPQLPEQSIKRIQDFLQQRYDASSLERVYAGDAAIKLAIKTPAGLGIGGFGRVYNFGHVTNRIYPHNLVLETAVEFGWVAGAFFVVLVLLAIARAYRAAKIEPSLRPFFAVLLFAFCNSLVSGDVNDNRIVYALICIALQSNDLIGKSLAELAEEREFVWAATPEAGL